MIKLRLPKPAATNVVSRRLYLGSVYTKEQMRAFAEKAVKSEREACAKVCEDFKHPLVNLTIDGRARLAIAVRARAQADGGEA
jgi:hypothetical protein